jgi:hypothetical protein
MKALYSSCVNNWQSQTLVSSLYLKVLFFHILYILYSYINQIQTLCRGCYTLCLLLLFSLTLFLSLYRTLLFLFSLLLSKRKFIISDCELSDGTAIHKKKKHFHFFLLAFQLRVFLSLVHSLFYSIEMFTL